MDKLGGTHPSFFYAFFSTLYISLLSLLLHCHLLSGSVGQSLVVLVF